MLTEEQEARNRFKTLWVRINTVLQSYEKDTLALLIQDKMTEQELQDWEIFFNDIDAGAKKNKAK